MSDCILHPNRPTTNGYVRIMVDGAFHMAHRHAWEQANGPIPDGMVIDHECHNNAARDGDCEGGPTCRHRKCINVQHLRMVTQSQNVLAGLHSTDVRGACPKGHSYPENIYVRPNGWRECAECNRLRSRRRWAKRSAA